MTRQGIFRRVVCLAAIVLPALDVMCTAELLPTERDAPPERLRALADMYESEDQPLEAASVYERLYELDSNKYWIVSQRLTRIYAEHGMQDEALQWAQVVMERNPKPQAYLSGVHVLLGNLDKAASILEEELSRKPDSARNLLLYWQLADVYQKQGNVREAESALLDFVRAATGRPEEEIAWTQLCRFYQAHGLLETRAEEWRKALAENPDDEVAGRGLAAAASFLRNAK